MSWQAWALLVALLWLACAVPAALLVGAGIRLADRLTRRGDTPQE